MDKRYHEIASTLFLQIDATDPSWEKSTSLFNSRTKYILRLCLNLMGEIQSQRKSMELFQHTFDQPINRIALGITASQQFNIKSFRGYTELPEWKCWNFTEKEKLLYLPWIHAECPIQNAKETKSMCGIVTGINYVGTPCK